MAKHIFLLEMQQGVHVIWHYDETYTGPFYLLKLFRKKMNHNTLCSIIVEKSSPSVARKNHKMGMSFSIEDLSL